MSAAVSDPSVEDSRSLLERIRELEDRNEILDLEGRYARTWDSGDAAGWAAVFTEDGVWEAVGAGSQSPHRVARGREELEALCARYATFLTGLHFLHPTELRIEGDTARSLVYVEFRGISRVPEEDEVIQRVASGYYLVRYRRVERAWRMQRREEHLVTFSSSAYVGGMLKPVL